VPWFPDPPSIADYEFWKWERSLGVRLVGKWPHPNTPRIDCRFRLAHSRPTLIPQASRWGIVYYERTLDYDPLFPEKNGIGWFDFEARDINHIGVTTGPDGNGFDFEINIKAFDELPFFGVPGVEFDCVITHDTFGEMHQTGEWLDDDQEIPWRYNMNTNFWHGAGRWVHFEADPGWPDDLEVDIWAVNECYPFKETPVGQAAMNGTDSYIALDHDLVNVNQDFIIEAEIRLHDTTTFWPLLGVEGAGGFCGMNNSNLIFGFINRLTSWTPVLDTWFKWRLEFEQDAILTYKLFIDDVEVLERTTNRQQVQFNTVGVYRHNVAGTIWANMDVRFLKFLTGETPSTTVAIDMPLQENAVDNGPDENHGTTFNMPLPSV
jgi:hypothetical protein